MSAESTPGITALLARWREGDRAAEPELLRTIYPALRDIARARLRGADLTLSATELAHETYLRLSRNEAIEFQDRGHFFAVAARATRHFVIDYLRARNSDKRGGGLPFATLDEIADDIVDDCIDLSVDWLAVDEAMTVLEEVDAASAQVVELKFFSGMTTDEIATAMDVSRATVVRDWRFAKAWLADRLESATDTVRK
ncbi:ECF-type sigma factor [Tahibacter sp.]|uniref:ECF-type sigma factor n=1 Tax=Tahibacter sp. TaxID=2056211 RepID=UPI0028C42C3D|nr:ECF-type sigma factor [Tahibacter sp.]